MSFCPNKDIHSVYLDNELPEEHKLSYEKHIQECESCRAQLERLKAVRKIFQDDASSITPDDHYLEDSYQRLMIKMSYSKNVHKAKKPSKAHFTYILSAAAAVLVALFIPNIIGTQKATQTPAVAEASAPMSISNFGTLPPMANNISFGSGNRSIVSGMINENALSPSGFVDVNFGNIPLSRSIWNQKGGIDDNVISIRITIPSFDTFPYWDSDLSGMGFSGNYQWNLPEN